MSFQKKYTITQRLLTSGSKRRSGLKIVPEVRFIVAHDTGNPDSSAMGNRNYYENTNNEISASAHIFVDHKQIVECIPALTTSAPEKAWHVLYNKPTDNLLFGVDANDAAIGIEYCYGPNIDADEAYRKFIWVIAFTCYKFNLDPKKSIVGHYFLDPERKTDPVTGLAHSRRTFEQLVRDVVIEHKECRGIIQSPQYNFVSGAGKVKVTHSLNIRKSFPNTNSAVVQTVSPGIELDFVGWVSDGQEVNGNTRWYRDPNGNYFWSGGVNMDSHSPPVSSDIDETKTNIGFKALNIPKIWNKSKGKGIKVAILDTGIVKNHPDLSGKVHKGKNLMKDNNDYEDNDGHGTHCAGIIAAQGNTIFGIAPECKLLIGKITEDGSSIDMNILEKGIVWAIKEGAEIISMSIFSSQDSPTLKKLLEVEKQKQHCHFIAAAGNQGHMNRNLNRFPASYDSCISVGAVDKNLNRYNRSNWSLNLDLVAPGVDIMSTYTQPEYEQQSGTSMATAFVSGVFALMRSYVKENNLTISMDELEDIVKFSADEKGETGRDNRYGYGIINPKRAFSKL